MSGPGLCGRFVIAGIVFLVSSPIVRGATPGSVARPGDPLKESNAPQATPAVQMVLNDGDRLLGEKKPEEALVVAQRALAAADKAADAPGLALTQGLRARAFEALGRHAEALAAWRQAADLWGRLHAVPEEIEALCAQGVPLGRDEPASASPLVEQAIALASKEQARPLASASALNAASKMAQGLGLLDMAGQLASGALAVSEKRAPGSLVVAASLNNLGNVSWAQSKLDAAQGYYERSLAIREKAAPGSIEVAGSLNNLGNVAADRGDLDAARSYYERGLAIKEKIAPDSLAVAVSLDNLGTIATDKGDLDAAQEFHERALAITEKLAPGSLTVAVSLSNLGTVAYSRGDLDAAWGYTQRALSIREALVPGSLDVAASFNNLGLIAADRGDVSAAREYHESALAVQEKLAPGAYDVVASLTNLGTLAAESGDFDAAREFHERALAALNKVSPSSPAAAMILSNLGAVARDSGHLDTARDYLQRALAIQESVVPGSPEAADTIDNLGLVAHDRGNLDSAWEYHQRALGIREKLGPDSLPVASSLDNLGLVACDKGDLDGASDNFQRALAIQERLAPASLPTAASLGGLGETLRRQGQMKTSEEYLDQAWSIVREQRRVLVGDEAERAFGAMRADVALRLVQVRLAQGKTAPAFQALEEGRAQALMGLLSERGLSQAASDPEAWRRYLVAERAFQRAGQALAADGEREAAFSAYTQARLERDRTLEQIRRMVPGLVPRAFTLEEARQALPKGSVLLSWIIGKEESTVFIIPAEPKHAVEAYAIPLSEAQLAERVDRLRKQINEGVHPRDIVGLAVSQQRTAVDINLIAASRRLFEDLFPPSARAAVAKADRMIVSPDGPLWDLPFAALVTNATGEPKWLGLQKKLSYTPSLTVLALERERPSPAPGGEVLVVGDPDLTSKVRVAGAPGVPPVGEVNGEAGSASPSLRVLRGERSSLAPGGVLPSRLPASGEEARRVAALYGTVALLGEAATEQAVRERISQAAVVHLATHGYFHPSLAMSSGLLLTPPEGEAGLAETDNDGALQAWEFGRTLPLTADLVVLSACETGRGEKVRGEGMVGLTRALQGAGARSVVATQWKVADAATAALMVSFHMKLKEGLAKDEALRRAMAETAAQPATRHPFFWAAFFLTGAPDSPLKMP